MCGRLSLLLLLCSALSFGERYGEGTSVRIAVKGKVGWTGDLSAKLSIEYRDARLTIYGQRKKKGKEPLFASFVTPHVFFAKVNSKGLVREMDSSVLLLPRVSQEQTGYRPSSKSPGRRDWGLVFSSQQGGLFTLCKKNYRVTGGWIEVCGEHWRFTVVGALTEKIPHHKKGKTSSRRRKESALQEDTGEYGGVRLSWKGGRFLETGISAGWCSFSRAVHAAQQGGFIAPFFIVKSKVGYVKARGVWRSRAYRAFNRKVLPYQYGLRVQGRYRLGEWGLLKASLLWQEKAILSSHQGSLRGGKGHYKGSLSISPTERITIECQGSYKRWWGKKRGSAPLLMIKAGGRYSLGASRIEISLASFFPEGGRDPYGNLDFKVRLKSFSLGTLAFSIKMKNHPSWRGTIKARGALSLSRGWRILLEGTFKNWAFTAFPYPPVPMRKRLELSLMFELAINENLGEEFPLERDKEREEAME